MMMEQEIENFVQSKLKDINVVDEIHEFLNFNFLSKTEINSEENKNIDDLYDEYYKIKRELQLKINLHTKDSIYKTCKVRQIPDDKMKASSDFTLEELILNYLQTFTNLSNSERHSSKIIIPDECFYCDTKLDINDYRCSVCLAVIAEMPEFVEKNELSQSTNEVIRDEEMIERNHSLQYINPHKNHNGYGESKIEVEDIEKFTIEDNEVKNEIPKYNVSADVYNILSHNFDMWLCSQCECLNPFSSLNCQGCQVDIKTIGGYWICQSCHKINFAQFDSCPTCKTKNLEFDKYQDKSHNNHRKCINGQKKKEDKVKQKSIPTTWACWNTNCKKQDNKENDTYCSSCKLQREAPNSMSDTVKCYQGGTPRDVWFCQKCAKKNIPKEFMCAGKNCRSLRFYVNPASDGTVTTPVIDKQYLNHDESDNTTELISGRNGDRWPCMGCTFMNEKGLSNCKVCSKPKNEGKNKNAKKEKVDNPDTWQCWYHNCRQRNASEQRFCQSCHLSRYAVRDRGSAVEYQNKEVQKLIWICPTCNTFNDLGNTLCKKRFCPAKRFEKEKK